MARYQSSSFLEYLSPPPLHLCFFVTILFFVLGLSWYINYESAWEDMMSQAKLFLMLCPLVLLLAVHCLSGGIPFLIPWPERDALHRAGGSPWGVALLLLFLIFIISFQSSFHERWFPLVTK